MDLEGQFFLKMRKERLMLLNKSRLEWYLSMILQLVIKPYPLEALKIQAMEESVERLVFLNLRIQKL